MENPRLVQSERVYSGRLFNVDLDTLEMHDGVIALRETLQHPGAVAMIPVDAEGNLILVTQYRHSARRRLLELPAGTLEKGEEPITAVARELQEEIGYAPGRVIGLGGFFVAPGYTSEYIHLFLCDELSVSVLPGDEDEDIEVHTLSPAEALAAIDDGRICDAKSVIGILRWARRAGH